jgi:hypothetical protein
MTTETPETHLLSLHNATIAMIGHVQLVRRRINRMTWFDSVTLDRDIAKLEDLARLSERRIAVLLEPKYKAAIVQILSSAGSSKPQSAG